MVPKWSIMPGMDSKEIVYRALAFESVPRIPYSSAEEVEHQIEKLLEMGKNGGYVIAPAHATTGDAKVENMEAMLRKILDQGDRG